MGTIKLGGLISGMDTETIIKQIIDAERVRVTAQETRRQAFQNQRDAWGKIKTSLETLRSKLDAIRFSGAYRARSATVADSSVASVTAASGAAMVTRTLKVEKLAQANRVASTAQVTDPAAALSLPSGTITINGKPVTVSATDSLYKLRNNINAAGAGVVAAGSLPLRSCSGGIDVRGSVPTQSSPVDSAALCPYVRPEKVA
jgi:flagellar hook-associated protein 2